MIRKSVYTIYKTTNLKNGNYYFGVHKTKNPYDEYLGSGTYMKNAIKKYGKQNFQKEVLFIYLDAESAFGKEDELIQCFRGLDKQCRNLRQGGSGGFDYINKNLPRPMQKLTEEKVIEIRRLAVEEGLFPKELGLRFEVCSKTIYSLLRGTAPSWRHVTNNEPVVSAHRAPKRGEYTEAHKEKIRNAQLRHFENNEEAKKKISDRFKKYWETNTMSPEHIRHLGEVNQIRTNAGRILFIKDGVKKLVKPEQFETFLSDGWKRGVTLCKIV